jgi:hypothetical protein
MKFYRQYDYPNSRLGQCGNITISTSGCFIVSLANLSETDPLQVNKILSDNNCFTSCNMLLHKDKAANLLDLIWNGRSTTKPNHICIAETYDTNAPQHFFIYDPINHKINDPLSTIRGWENCHYNIVSYRLFKSINNQNSISNQNIETDLNKISVKDLLKNILKEQKKYYTISDSVNSQEGRESAAKCGRWIRTIEENLGLDISL